MKVLNWIIVALIGALTLSLVAVVAAQDGPTANVEVRVWQSTADPERVWISARPEGGSWATLGTIPLSMEETNARETLRYEDITLAVPVDGGPAVDDSEPCSQLQQALEGRAEFTLVSCVGVYHPPGDKHDSGWAVWNASGVIRVGGRELRYSGGYPAEQSEPEFSILWDLAEEGYPCTPVTAALEEEFGVRIIRCNASGSFSTVDGGYYRITGRAFDANNEYYYSARINDDLTRDGINWDRLVPVYSE